MCRRRCAPAPRRVPRDRRAARPRGCARPAGSRPGERAGGKAGHASSSGPRRYQALEAHAADLQQTLGVRAAGTPALTPVHRWQSAAGWRAVDASRPGDIPSPSPRSRTRPHEVLFGFVPPAADERVLRRIRRDYRAVVAQLSRRAKGSIGRARRGTRRSDTSWLQRAAGGRPRREREGARLPNERRDAGARSRRTEARTRLRATSSSRVSAGSVILALALGFVLLLVVDRADSVDGGAPRRSGCRRLRGEAGRPEPRRAWLTRGEHGIG